jgi:hypothetical protein
MRPIDSGDVVFSDYCARVTFFFPLEKRKEACMIWQETGSESAVLRNIICGLGLRGFGGGGFARPFCLAGVD